MEKVEICEILRDTVYLVRILQANDNGNPQTIGWGSAVAVNPRGDLLTAAHVVTTRLPIRAEDLRDPQLVVLAMKKGDPGFRRYSSPLCGLSVNVNDMFQQPLTIDLAVLRPVGNLEDVPYLLLSAGAPRVGQEVVMAGYPDDVELPFAFDEFLPLNNPQVRAQQANLEVSKKLMMMRSGMIGHVSSVTINELNSGHILHIDNVLHSGASGGPVVDENAELIGIVTKRAITRVPFEETPDLRVPSGAAVAIAPQILLPNLQELNVLE